MSVRTVAFHRANTHVQIDRDLFVAKALRKPAQHIHFPGGEQVLHGNALSRLRRRQRLKRGLGSEEFFAGQHFLHYLHNSGRCFVLSEKCAGARLFYLPHDRFRGVNRKDGNPYAVNRRYKSFRYLKTINHRHREIHDKNIGSKRLAHFNCFLPVYRFANDIPFRVGGCQYP